MSSYYPYYMAAWISACLVAVWIAVRDKRSIALFGGAYWNFLLRPWKVGTFLIAVTVFTIMAPYTGDPTWDYLDAPAMSIMCFLTAPWVVGVMWRVTRKELPWAEAYVGWCVWMFSASWAYDAYITVRDGVFSPLWWENIFASSGLYLLGGLFWNLKWVPGRGTIFAFMEKDWPIPEIQQGFRKVLWPALIFMLIVFLLMLPFLVDWKFPWD
ncbi:MAG: hypothetical protein AB1646_12110 [Thermodesulfobacteriota bacterium]